MKNLTILALTLSLCAGQAVFAVTADENTKPTQAPSKLREAYFGFLLDPWQAVQKSIGAAQVVAGIGMGAAVKSFTEVVDIQIMQYRDARSKYKHSIARNMPYDVVMTHKRYANLMLREMSMSKGLRVGMLGSCAYLLYSGISKFNNNTGNTTSARSTKSA